MSLGGRAPEVVHVVVPAHNEERLLARCLEAVDIACRRLRVATGATTRVTVVLDRCTDATAGAAARHPVDVVVSDAGCVGRARELGVARASQLASGVEPDRVWIATTDADSVVGADWLTRQHRLAGDGYALVVGGVHPDPADIPAELARAWHARHRGTDSVLHVHGANLGFTLGAHGLAGGFPPVAEHEDVVFVRAVIAAGCRWTTLGEPVRTSARLTGRVGGGFSGYLRGLAASLGG